MRTLATLQEPDAGIIRPGDIDVVKQKGEGRKTLGYLPQEFGMYARSSAEPSTSWRGRGAARARVSRESGFVRRESAEKCRGYRGKTSGSRGGNLFTRARRLLNGTCEARFRSGRALFRGRKGPAVFPPSGRIDSMKGSLRDPAVLSRMKMAFDLYETAEAIMRQNLRRRFPDAPEAEIERRLVAWLHHRPGAEHGDAEGRPSRSFERFDIGPKAGLRAEGREKVGVPPIAPDMPAGRQRSQGNRDLARLDGQLSPAVLA